MSAGDAHVDGRSVSGYCAIGHALLSDRSHPCRSAGRSPRRGCYGIRPAPRHPARATTESTAGLLARGSLPVTAFPGGPSGNVARARRLQLRGQLRPWNCRSAPHSLFALA
jgi:hypothetical protein